ncbi:MAG TPA: autotransporter strand-loop-strand O-heptosyltransferase [Methylocystis sp.]|nr:autotransporter strand-loop-strand O-heptosyltransferase [Methylocystis sp.]HXZ17444.1 autotransporter strand-loop-strand O-heptosyltransferase [Roseiarcus sp.]
MEALGAFEEASTLEAPAQPPKSPPFVASASAAAEPAQKSPYPPPASVPTQEGPKGIRFDFNSGARVLLPTRESGKWIVRLRDLDTGNILFESENKGAYVSSSKRFYVRFSIEVWEAEDDGSAQREVMRHELDLAWREVAILFPVGTLGDLMGWFPYAARFKEAHPQAQVTCALSPQLIELLRDAYPELNLVTHDEFKQRDLAATAYATYCVGLFFDDAACNWQPTDFRHVGLHRTAGYILGVDPTEIPARLALKDGARPIAEPYAVIAVQSSSACKFWNNPNGWREVIAFLKGRGYRVICIDQKPVHGQGLMWTHIPNGAEDETGDRPLSERARWLKHADLFIGLSSGLSWLAWAAGCPVVMISGFTHPTNEFYTPYRVHNWHACNSCWNDVTLRFDHYDFFWCPRHKETPRHFECTRLITPAHVIRTIEKVPGLRPAT